MVGVVGSSPIVPTNSMQVVEMVQEFGVSAKWCFVFTDSELRRPADD